jgi:acyl carrier protein
VTATYDLITATLIETFELDAGQLTPQSTFEDLGLDSLALVEMALVVHEHTGTAVEGITPQSTLAEAAALLASAADGTSGSADAADAADGADGTEGPASRAGADPAAGPSGEPRETAARQR